MSLPLGARTTIPAKAARICSKSRYRVQQVWLESNLSVSRALSNQPQPRLELAFGVTFCAPWFALTRATE
jgi:hypothetical protein